MNDLLGAIGRQDREALTELLTEDVVFHSPVQTYRGRERIVHLLATIGGIIEDVERSRTLDGVTLFTARVGEHPIDGVLVERSEGPRIAEITLMIRPLAALQAAVARMTRVLASGGPP